MHRTIRPTMTLALLALLVFAGAYGVEAQEDAMASQPAQENASSEGAEAPATPCATPEHRQFDFWIGEWEVRDPQGALQGTNRIERILGGCALMESWEGTSGSRGKSFNTYSAAHGEWRQFWVADGGYILELAGGLDADGRMVLAGDSSDPEQPTSKTLVRHEISWQPLADGSVRQHWRTSKDGGETWRDLFVGIYTRKR